MENSLYIPVEQFGLLFLRVIFDVPAFFRTIWFPRLSLSYARMNSSLSKPLSRDI